MLAAPVQNVVLVLDPPVPIPALSVVTTVALVVALAAVALLQIRRRKFIGKRYLARKLKPVFEGCR